MLQGEESIGVQLQDAEGSFPPNLPLPRLEALNSKVLSKQRCGSDTRYEGVPDREKQPDATPSEKEEEYPSVRKLVLLIIALCLAVFCVSLVSPL
jgi:hypothetical protein